MLGALTTKWPRVFTTLGFGFSFIFTLVATNNLSETISKNNDFQDRLSEIKRQIDSFEVDLNSGVQFAQLERDSNQLQSEVEHFLDSTALSQFRNFLAEMGETERVVWGFGAIFLAYLLGELLISTGRIFVSVSEERHWNKRIAFVAVQHNSFLAANYEARVSLMVVIQGCLSIFLSQIGNMTFVFWHMLSWWMLATVLFISLLIIAFASLGMRRIGTSLDEIILEFRAITEAD